MKTSNNQNQNQDQTPTTAARPARAAAGLNPTETNFAVSADEVERRAYFSYVNQGSQPGHDVQHWLEAEAQLLAERNLTRVHGFHNRT
ncbi:MAG: hypothetical protein QOJ40_357 [Verrucomicrobiota bacterium]